MHFPKSCRFNSKKIPKVTPRILLAFPDKITYDFIGNLKWLYYSENLINQNFYQLFRSVNRTYNRHKIDLGLFCNVVLSEKCIFFCQKLNPLLDNARLTRKSYHSDTETRRKHFFIITSCSSAFFDLHQYFY
jgi:hypothetical protein